MIKKFHIEAVETIAKRCRWTVEIDVPDGWTLMDERDAAIDAFHEGNRHLVSEKEVELIDSDITNFERD